MPLPAGTRLGPYEILGLIGAGGMGEVYRARDTRLERTVALKILPPRLAHDPALRARFQQEGQAFLVMEHLTGETLADRLKKGPIPLPQALEAGIQIADALAAAHKQG